MPIEPQASAFARECLAEHLSAFLSELSALKRRMRSEWIHSTRVHSRRTRAALEAFRDTYPEAPWRALYDQVRWVTSALGKLRERDVSLAILSDLTHGGDMAENLCREYLAERLARRQRRMRAKLEKRLRQVGLRRLRALSRRLLGCRLPAAQAAGSGAGTGSGARRGRRRSVPEQASLFALGEPPVERARTILAARIAPVLDFCAAGRMRKASPAQIHELRIAAKKLRYIMEIFEGLWPGELKRPIARARAVQDAIGAYHDWTVLGDRIEREIARAARHEASHLAFQLGRLRTQVAERQVELREQIAPRLKDLDEALRHLQATLDPARAAPPRGGPGAPRAAGEKLA